MATIDDSQRALSGSAPPPSRSAPLIGLAKSLYWLSLVAMVGALASAAAGSGRHSAQSVLRAAASPGGHGVQVATGELAASAPPEQPPLLVRHLMQSSPEAPSVHASTIARMPDGELIAAWFGGSREGAADVSIYASNWSPQSRRWQTPRVLSDRAQSSRELGRHVKKLGNPVLFCDASGRLWLYYVTVSVGGWSGGSISVKASADQGKTWSDARRILAAPFLNTSNLVRSTPLALADGGVLLPVYHEFLCQFGELLHLNAEGHLVQKYRMNSGGDSLQPTLVPISSRELLAFYRRGGKSQPRVLSNRSSDGGKTWSPIAPTELANPNASVAALRMHGGEMLMALNPSEQNREQLALAVSADGEHWRLLEVLEDGSEGQEFSYPTLIRGAPGEYHLTYTWNREKICHVRFNDAWLEAKR